MIARPKCPCTQTCQERNAECHSKCERYSVYEKEMRNFYEQRAIMALSHKPVDIIRKNIDRKAKSKRSRFI